MTTLKQIFKNIKHLKGQYYHQHCQKYSICVSQKGSISGTSSPLVKLCTYPAGQDNCHLLDDSYCDYYVSIKRIVILKRN